MIKIQGSASKGWLHQEAGFKFEERYYFDPMFRFEQDRAIDAYLDERFPGYAIYNMESNLGQIEHTLSDQIIVGGIQPNLIFGLAVGAKFFCEPDKDSDITIRPLEDILHEPEKYPTVEAILASPIVKQLDELIARTRTDHPELRLIPPFFWDTSGRATIHGLVTTSMKLFGEGIFLLMLDEPELVKQIHGWITDVYVALIKHYSELGDIAPTCIHVGECTGTLLSPDQYEDFIVPFASRLGREIGPLRWHSCGDSNHLVEPLSEADNLKIMDTGSMTSMAHLRETLGDKIELSIAPPVEILLERSDPNEINTWLDRTLEENEGGPLRFVHHLEPGYSLEANLRLHDLLDEKGIVAKSRWVKKSAAEV